MNEHEKLILSGLKVRHKELSAELGRLEKAMAVYEGAPATKAKKTTSAIPPNAGESSAITMAAVLGVCRGEFCNAEKVSIRLKSSDTTKIAGLLSKAFSKGLLEREGERGSYEYKFTPKAPKETPAEAARSAGEAGSPFGN